MDVFMRWMVLVFIGLPLVGTGVLDGCKRRVGPGEAPPSGEAARSFIWTGINRASASCWTETQRYPQGGVVSCVDGGRLFRCITEDEVTYQCAPLMFSTSAEAR